MCLLVNIAKCFDSKPPVASVDFLFLIKSNVGWFPPKSVDLVVPVIYTLLAKTIPTRFYWFTCRNEKLVKNKPLQQSLFDLILRFWQSFLTATRTRTHNHLVHKRTLNHLDKLARLTKWLSIRLWTKWLWVRVQLQSLKLQVSRLLQARSS